MDRYKLAALLNAVATIGASLQATHVLDVLGPTGLAVAAAVLAAINSYLHGMPDPAAVKK